MGAETWGLKGGHGGLKGEGGLKGAWGSEKGGHGGLKHGV